MKIYSNGPDAIYDLHRKGFSNDFQFTGNDLLWAQENVTIRAGEFAILEYQKITGSNYHRSDLLVFGIIALCHNIKGILIKHSKSNAGQSSPVLMKKMNELNRHANTII